MLGVLDHDNESMREGSDVTGAARSGETNRAVSSFHLRRIQIPETVYFGSAEEAEIDLSRLQQTHHAYHVETLRRAEQIRRIGHRVDQLRRWGASNQAIFEQSNTIRSVRFLRDDEGDQWQAHANENNFAVANLAGSSGHHEL